MNIPAYDEVRAGDENASSDVQSGCYELRTPITPEMRVLDLGAHVGGFTKRVSIRCKSVIAFEPEPFNYKRLLKSIEELPNVIAINAAAYDEYGQREFYINHGNSGGHGFHPASSYAARIIVRTVDIGSWLSRIGFVPDFIKIDTEGSEFHILQSLIRANVRASMSIEAHSGELYRQCKAILESDNYSFEPANECVGICYAIPK